MEVKLTALLGNYDRPTDQPTDQQTGKPGHRVVTLPKNELFQYCKRTRREGGG